MLLIFRRADLVRRQIEGLRSVRPFRVYVAGDGPRPDHPDDASACQAAREALADIDWPCELRTLFRPSNLGLKRAVSQAIDWFFEQEDQGIILEEDCLPHPSFFPYCGALLDRYRHDVRVMQISGTNFQPERRTSGGQSYFFSRYNHVWGWATWRRAWTMYRRNFEGLGEFLEETSENGFWENRREKKYWSKMFARAQQEVVGSWAYRWTYTIWVEGGLCIYPETNMVSNLGFDTDATNTIKPDKVKGSQPVRALTALTHPSTVMRNRPADGWTFEHLYWGDPVSRTVHRAEKLGRMVGSFFTRATVRRNSAPKGAAVRCRTTPYSPSKPVGPATVCIRQKQ